MPDSPNEDVNVEVKRVYLTKRQIAILANLCHHAIEDPENSFAEVSEARSIQAELLRAAPELTERQSD